MLHVLCDLTIAADHARFGQAGPRVGSFDAGFGSAYLARIVGEKRAREIWFLCRQYDAATMRALGPRERAWCRGAELRAEVRRWADEILAKSPTALRFLKHSFNARQRVDLAGSARSRSAASSSFAHSQEAREGDQRLRREASARLLSLPGPANLARAAVTLRGRRRRLPAAPPSPRIRPAAVRAASSPSRRGCGSAGPAHATRRSSAAPSRSGFSSANGAARQPCAAHRSDQVERDHDAVADDQVDQGDRPEHPGVEQRQLRLAERRTTRRCPPT